MNCPYCKREMQEGFIYSGKTDLHWTPKDEQQSWLINRVHESEVMLCKWNIIKGAKIKVFRCAACQIQLIDETNLCMRDE